MRTGDTALQTQALCFICQLLDVPGLRIVGLVAMDVDQKPATGGNFAKLLQTGRAIGHGALEVRNTADHVHALVQRAAQRVKRAGRVAVALRPAGYDSEVVYLVTLMQNLGRLVVLDYILTGERFNELAAHLALVDRGPAQALLRNQRDQLVQRVRQYLEVHIV